MIHALQLLFVGHSVSAGMSHEGVEKQDAVSHLWVFAVSPLVGAKIVDKKARNLVISVVEVPE